MTRAQAAVNQPVHLRTVPEQNREETVAILRELLAKAEAGEVIAVSGIAEEPGGTYSDFGSATLSRLQTAGALLELAVRRLE